MTQAKYFFLQLGITVALYTVVGSFISFCFDIINYIFPDRQAYAFSPYSTGMKFSISFLVVVFPVFIYLSRMMYKSLMEDPSMRERALRKWLSYLTLFIAGLVVVGDLIATVNTFLNGEISERFIWKALTLLLVSLGVFWYVIRDLKGIYFEKPKNLMLVAIISSFVVVVGIISGLSIVGLPQDQRKLNDDRTRENNLREIQSNVVSHYQRTGELPQTLEDTIDPLYKNYNDSFNDPETKIPYEYRIASSTNPKFKAFELCATFSLDTPKDTEGRGSYPKGYSSNYLSVDYYSPYGRSTFEHTAGRNCFTRLIDPVRYSVNKPLIIPTTTPVQ